MQISTALSALLAAALVLDGHAETLTVEAFDNATVQPGGPRSGSSGKAFFNIEGSGLGNFASYGVARFNITTLKQSFDNQFGSGGWQLDQVTVSLTQSNAAFSATGGVGIRHSGDDTSSIQAGVGTLTYPVSGDFADLGNLIDYTFTPIATGTLEQYTLFQAAGSNGSGASQLRADLLLDSIVTLVFVDLTTTVAATYAGATNFTLAGPTLGLSVSAVPVPAALPLLLSSLGVLLARRRRAPAL
jgi:hypothetical protein